MNRVVHFEIQADDIERARKFYKEVMGWEISQIMDKEKSGMMDYWQIVTGDSVPGINGGLYKRTDGPDAFHLFDCTVEVADIDKAVEAIKTNGGTITREKVEMPGVGWFASAKDTEGNRFGIMQAIPGVIK